MGLVYCIGFGILFLFVVVGFGWVGGLVVWVKWYIWVVNIVGGVLFIVIGLFMVSGVWCVFILGLGVSYGFMNFF